MNETILTELDIIRGSLPVALIDDDGYDRLAHLTGMLPMGLTSFWGFECRLGRPEASADVLFEIKKNSKGMRLLSGNESSLLDEICDKWPTWQNLRRFAKLWADPKNLFQEQIRNIWLEFDTANINSYAHTDDVIQQFCFFLGTERIPLNNEQLYSLIHNAFSTLGQAGLSDNILKSFIRSLPDGSRLFQAGLMMARQSCDLRVCVNHLSPEAIPGWLTNLNWSGDVNILRELLETITPLLRTVALDLNLTKDGPEEKIGLECYMGRIDDDPEQWAPLLDFLQKNGLCMPQKRRGLMEYAGTSHLSVKDRINNDGVMTPAVFRMIHHLKLGILKNRIEDAKAYLAIYRPGINLKGILSNSNSENSGGPQDSWIID